MRGFWRGGAVRWRARGSRPPFSSCVTLGTCDLGGWSQHASRAVHTVYSVSSTPLFSVTVYYFASTVLLSTCECGRTIRAQRLTILAPLWPPSRSCLGIFGLCDWAEDSGRVSPSEICTSQICTKFVKSPMAALRLRRASPPDRNPPLSRSLAEAAVPSASSAKGGAQIPLRG